MSLTHIDLSNLRTNGDIMTDSSRMFEGCTKLEYLDIRGLNVRAQTDMSDIFKGCTSLATIVRGKEFYCNSYKAYMPSPDPAFIPGADGYWYYLDTGYAYLNRDVPSNKEATYVAVNPVKAPTVTIDGEAVYGSTLTAKVSEQPAGSVATSYQWKCSKDGISGWVNSDLIGSKSASLDLTKIDTSGNPAGYYYRCVVTTTAGLIRVPQGMSAVVGPVETVAFAVFSEDDGSLNFYKRAFLPKVGTQFEGKIVTDIYKGFEKSRYHFVSTPDSYWGSSTSPWASIQSTIKSVKIVDNGIKPKYTSLWFANFTNLINIDVSKLDTSACMAMNNTFFNMRLVQTLDLSTWNVSNVTDFNCMFQECLSLRELNIKGWKARPVGTGCFGVFYDCISLRSLDLSGFDLGQAYNANGMFGRCYQLSHVIVGDSWRFVGYGLTEGMDPFLPAPSADIFADADGKWYAASDGKGYAPANIPSNKADTYYASKNLLPKFNGVNLNLNENNIVDKNNNDNKIELGLNSKDSYIDIQQTVDNLNATVNKNSNDSKLNKNDHIIKNDIATADQSNNQIYNNTYYSDKNCLEIEINIT